MKGKRVILALLGITLIVEGFLHFATSPDYYWPYRQLYFSQSAFRATGLEGLWTYSPDTDVVEAAVYTLPGQSPKVEYLCHFRTNALGLVDTNWEAERRADYLVLGDSFTQGSGGCPWLSRSQLGKDSPLIINGGLQGVGMQSYHLLERWLSNTVDIDQVVLILTSQSFNRTPPARFWDDTNSNGRFLWYVEPTVSGDDLLRLAGERLLTYPINNHPIGVLQRQTAYLKRLYSAIVGNEDLEPAQEILLEQNFSAFLALQANFPKLKVILVPEKHETGFARIDDSLTRRVKNFFTTQNVDYSSCNLDRSDFLTHDGHPNESGYRKLSACLQARLRTQQ